MCCSMTKPVLNDPALPPLTVNFILSEPGFPEGRTKHNNYPTVLRGASWKVQNVRVHVVSDKIQ